MNQTEWTVGAHRLRFEEPDLVMAELIGPVGMGDAKELVRVLREIGASRPYYFGGDVSRSTIKGEARRYVGEGMSEAWLKGLIYYGVGPLHRAMGKAIMLAMYFSGHVGIDAHMFATKAEALAHIEKMRLKASQSELGGAAGGG